MAMRLGLWLTKADGHDEFCSVVAGMRGIRGGLLGFFAEYCAKLWIIVVQNWLWLKILN